MENGKNVVKWKDPTKGLQSKLNKD